VCWRCGRDTWRRSRRHPSQLPAPAAPIEILPRFSFHLSAEHLSGDDQAFVWDANYGGELDLVDYRAGRATFYANYQVVMGEEFHAFDPNQGNYILGGRVSARLRGAEAALVFHHESRHLSDRPKREPVDWNMLGARLTRPTTLSRAALEPRVDVRRTILKSYVDYTWEIDAGLRARMPLVSRVSLVSMGNLRQQWVDGSRGRDAQTGARGEAGIRLDGRGAAVEVFVAVERRIDPYPLSFGTSRWFTAWFRLLHP
jgi:hypothetical protein